MLGTRLKTLLEEKGMKVPELSAMTGVSTQTIYSMIKRDSSKVDIDALVRICAALEVPLETICKCASPESPDVAEWELLRRWRELDEHGRRLVRLVMNEERARLRESAISEETVESEKIIPLYLTPAAAGFASPVVDEDYRDYSVPASSKADFAVMIAGDSMEPYIKDGSVALVRRGEAIRDGDVGLFFADSGMVVKQYCQDYIGDVRLFSLNRKRRDADVYIPAVSDMRLCCFGKLLLDKDIPLPKE